jgi:hypothetical protein
MNWRKPFSPKMRKIEPRRILAASVVFFIDATVGSALSAN